MKIISLGLKLVVVLASLVSGLACGFISRTDRNSSNFETANVNSNKNFEASVSPTPELKSNLPKYRAQQLAVFLKKEYQKTGGKGDANAGLIDKEIEITGNVSLVNASEVVFFVDQTTRVRCQGSFVSNKEYPALESYHRDNISGTTRFMPNARAKGIFKYWGSAPNSRNKDTEIVLTDCDILGAARM
ncbi:MAG: hypothetical protein ABJA66_07570 [Actinomycetota bacterium]